MLKKYIKYATFIIVFILVLNGNCLSGNLGEQDQTGRTINDLATSGQVTDDQAPMEHIPADSLSTTSINTAIKSIITQTTSSEHLVTTVKIPVGQPVTLTNTPVVQFTATTIVKNSANQTSVGSPPVSFVNPDGETLKDRFPPPEGYTRAESEPGSFEGFLQSLPLKPNGTKVMYFDGREKARDVHLAVVDYSLGDRDLQQCADAVIRLRAEYLFSSGQRDKISFNFVSGFTASFSKWSSGYGISVDGNNVSWRQNSNNDSSYDSFQKYLDTVYMYANTYSLERELVDRDFVDLAIGDVFIVGGFPGHCVIVADMAINITDGAKVFILAQSYMPAQDIQILKGDSGSSPWYTADENVILKTPEWTFEKSRLKTWK